MRERSPWKLWDRTEGIPTPTDDPPLSATALSGLDRQLGEALALAVSCRLLSDWSRSAGDPLTAVTLEHLSADLSDQAAMLAPFVLPERPPPVPPILEPSPSGLDGLSELGHRLSHAALVAQTDAMTPGLETMVVGLLWSLAALYRTRRELLLVCTLLDSA
jgi:hypothetical protein